jgi:hypothetical protein
MHPVSSSGLTTTAAAREGRPATTDDATQQHRPNTDPTQSKSSDEASTTAAAWEAGFIRDTISDTNRCDMTNTTTSQQSKKQLRKEGRKKRRAMQRDATRQSMQIPFIQSMTPIIIRRRRDNERAEAMRSSGKVYDWTDPIFQNFFRVTGDCSKLLYICETTTRH